MTTISFCAPVARDLVVVHGPDATKFLQSLVSQDLVHRLGESGPSRLLLDKAGLPGLGEAVVFARRPLSALPTISSDSPRE